MEWNLDKGRPISIQIYEQVCMSIALGIMKPGERLLSVRETAVSSGVNPNTVQHAYEKLAELGIVYSQPGSGWYVCDDIAPAQETLIKLREEKTRAYFAAMETLGASFEEAKTYVKEWNK